MTGKTRVLMATALLAAALPAYKAVAGETLSLATYNIHSGIPMGFSSANHGITDADLGNIADVITSSGADIVALQEVRCEFTPRSKNLPAVAGHNQPRELSRLTGMHYVFGSAIDDAAGFPANTGFLEAGKGDRATSRGAERGEYGNALLSRFACLPEPENIALPNLPGKEQRACLRVALKDSASSPVVVYATHLQHDSAEARAEQMRHVLGKACAEPAGTVVFLMGDFNAGPGESGGPVELARAAGFRDLHEQYARAAGGDAGPTFPADKPEARIDYIFCNAPVRVVDARVIETLASDHRPLVVRIQFTEK
jgi:endonuclease/exonuclease/phosphatase family metal-dependent hydrolase